MSQPRYSAVNWSLCFVQMSLVFAQCPVFCDSIHDTDRLCLLLTAAAPRLLVLNALENLNDLDDVKDLDGFEECWSGVRVGFMFT